MNYAITFFMFIGLPFISIAQVTTSVKGELGQSSDGVGFISISFNDIPKIIIEKNENYRAARGSVKAHEERTGHLLRSFLPEVSATLGEEEFKMNSGLFGQQRNWQVGASVNIYRGGRDRIDEKIRLAQVSEAKIALARDYQTELRQARIAYWEAVAFKHLFANRQEELRLNEESLRSAKKRFGAGITGKADLTQFELYRMDLEQNIKLIKLQSDVARARLARILGMNEHQNLFPQDDFPNPDPSTLKEFDTENQLDVKAEKTRGQIDELRSAHSSRWWYPDLDLYAYHGVPLLLDDLTPLVRDDRETVIGLRMKFNLGKGLDEVADAKASKLNAKSSNYRATYKAREVKTIDYEIRQELNLTATLIVDNKKLLSKARELLKNTQAEYARGIKNGPDLLFASRQFFDILDRTVHLNREFYSGQADLENLTAKMVPL